MDNFIYHAPTRIVFGRNTVSQTGAELAAHNVRRTLLVTGGSAAMRTGAYAQVTASLDGAGVMHTLFSGVTPNPSLDLVEKGIAAAHAFAADSVLAIGGGSVIDCAKAIAAGVFLEDYWAQVETRRPVTQALPVFTVLTLSGTGSEMNEKAVITNEPLARKWSLSGLCLCPRVSIIDPQLQSSVPWHLTAAGGIDAMTHVMENYFRGRTARAATGYFQEETTLQLCEGILRAIIMSLDELQRDGSDYTARANLAWAASWGLNGLSGSGLSGGDWTSHALEHALSGLHPQVPHGEGLAVIFPSWMEQVCHSVPDIFTRFARTIWGVSTAEEGVAATRQAFSRWGAPDRLSRWNIPASDIPRMVQNALSYRALGRIVPLSAEDVTSIYTRVL
ncbi:iron-containing alcohol dehydrogenase [Oleidesulfovibrio alaskensis]|jgi:alcohol dehydrogenase|uniref:iron-containing alcohol dehydrogenase n=1 Tax=Oleidesulfovibrio alaskensis TaxID=58180 RepID=UPI001A60732E|nr:iron-containing alcohol dehydrogenase [Oleidesulfovibrio alaskensis]MBL3581551.1 iron-containing alcohol dehydrogenase [Oleidesulfovibrio alaskensis]